MLINFRQLWPKYGINPVGVLHVGANTGEEALVYHELGVSNVTWVEANPKVMDTLRENLSKYPGQRGFNFCVGDEDKDTVLHLANNDGVSSSVLELGHHKIAHPTVDFIEDIPMKMWRLDSLYMNGELPTSVMPDYLNMDIQGMELAALKGLGSMVEIFKWIYLEVNFLELYKDCGLVDEIDEYLKQFMFERVETKKAGDTGWADALYIKR